MAYGTHNHKNSPIHPIVSHSNHFFRIEAYSFKVHSNTLLPSTPRSPRGCSPVLLTNFKAYGTQGLKAVFTRALLLQYSNEIHNSCPYISAELTTA